MECRRVLHTEITLHHLNLPFTGSYRKRDGEGVIFNPNNPLTYGQSKKKYIYIVYMLIAAKAYILFYSVYTPQDGLTDLPVIHVRHVR